MPFVDLPEIKPEKVKEKTPKVTPNARLEVSANRIKKKYQRQRQKGCLKNVNKKAANLLKKAGYLETYNLETINYKNDVSLNDIGTVDYNMDTQPNELDNEQWEKHPRGRMKNKDGQIARDNVCKLMRGEFDFNPKKYEIKHCYLTLKK